MSQPVRQFLSRMYRQMPSPLQRVASPLRDVILRRGVVRQMNEEILPAAAFIRHHAANHPGEKIVIDCGFNTGVVLKAFLKELPGFKFYGFEVNPEFQSVAHDFRQNNPNIIDLIFAAVSDSDADVTFWLAGDAEGVHKREGTTILPDKQSYMTEYEKPLTARGVDFSRWLREKQAQHTGPQGSPFIAVKMDIEGAEVPLLEHMIKTGAMGCVNVLIVEFHADQFDENVREATRAREQKILAALENSPTAVHLWF